MTDQLRSLTLHNQDVLADTAKGRFGPHAPPMTYPPDPKRHAYGAKSALAKLLAAIQPRK